MILARTLKGKGLAAIEGKDGWHGKALKKGEETDKAIAELEKQIVPDAPKPAIPAPRLERAAPRDSADYSKMPGARLQDGRLGGHARSLGRRRSPRSAASTSAIVALDADVKNSTFSDRFEKAHPDRFFENFIAEQVMVGAAMGLAARGAIPFPSTFACFLTRAADFIRMARHLVRRTSSWPARTPASRSARTARRRWRSKICR